MLPRKAGYLQPQRGMSKLNWQAFNLCQHILSVGCLVGLDGWSGAGEGWQFSLEECGGWMDGGGFHTGNFIFLLGEIMDREFISGLFEGQIICGLKGCCV